MTTPYNIARLEALAGEALSEMAFAYATGGADDERTVAANRAGFELFQLRCRRLVDVSRIDTRVQLFGQELAYPILLAPVGYQQVFHAEAELATARAATAEDAQMIASTVSFHSVGEIAAAGRRPVWFQLYPTNDRGITRALLERAEAAGSPVVMLTVDTPIFGNRERHGGLLNQMIDGDVPMGNLEGLRTNEPTLDPALTWDIVDWLRANTSMQVVLKGIVTREDGELCVGRGAQGLVVSNHGGRQEESGRSTIECLPEVVEGVAGRLPILFDGGIRRGTDIFKALALGADAVCIGRPYVYGLAALGEEGVRLALAILREELVRAMQLAGTPTLAAIDSSFVLRRP